MADQKKRTRRTKAQIEADRATQLEEMHRGTKHGREPVREERADIRQKPQKPLKLDVTSVKRDLEKQHGKSLQLKWVKHQSIAYLQENGWKIVDSSMKQTVNRYTPDGRLKTDDQQSNEGGAYTVLVGPDEYNFLMYKDLAQYMQEDAVWDKQEADRPMDSIQNTEEVGERAGLSDAVEAYQHDVKISKQREAY